MTPASTAAPILVIGAGYVGLVTAVGLAGLGHQVHLVEIRPDRLQMLRRGLPPIYEAGLPEGLTTAIASGALTVSAEPIADAGIALVCVGTPLDGEGRSDLSQLRGALAGLLPFLGSEVPLVIRSTVPPGSTRLAVEWSGVPPRRVFSNPEFLRQGTALEDFRRPTRIVIGRFPDADPAALAHVESLYDGIDAPRLIVDVAAAELIKNGANAFLALKLSFTNEIASLCEEYGTDVDEVIAGIALDPRIGGQYMRPSFGFGGSCLPKELQALAAAGAARGLPMDVTIAAARANNAHQARFATRIEKLLGGLEGRTVGLLGLAFKAGTDDVRDSPALGLASRLMAGGATVRAYDPQAGGNALLALPQLGVVASATEALDGADAAVIGTEWPEFRVLDWGALKGVLRRPLIVDGRRLLDGPAMEALGYRYEAVGRGTPADQPAPRPPTGSLTPYPR